MTIDALPSLDRTSASFRDDCNSFFGTALPAFVIQANALQADVNAKQTTASTAATTATTKAAEAAASEAAAAAHVVDAETAVTAAGEAAGAAKWVSGTSYAEGVCTWSPTDRAVYRRNAPGGVSTTDPASDTTGWTAIAQRPAVQRSARTSNTILSAADRGRLIDVTSGTFTQTFDAAATLGSGWYCWYRNNGSGDITIPASDGRTNWIMYPGEARLFQCDGSAVYSVVVTPFYKVATASGNFIKPPGYSRFAGLLWGGGASGKATINATGGGGGGCAPIDYAASALSDTEAFVIGSGGAATTTTTQNAGGNSTFKGITAYGANNAGAGGSAILLGVTSSNTHVLGGGPYSFYGGGVSLSTNVAFPVVYGGGAGGGVDTSPTGFAGGSTVHGGAGGAGSGAGNGTAGTAPGGGGGSCPGGFTSGAGARGELRIWGVV